MCDPWDSQENKKIQLLFLLRCFDFLTRNEKYNFRRMENKKPFEIILDVGRVTSLQNWAAKSHVTIKPLQMNVLFFTTLPTLMACNSP